MSAAENERPQAQPLAGADLDETPTELVEIAALRPHPRNYKKHPQAQVAHVLETIRLAGVYKNIVIARDGTILMGHGVVEAATQGRALEQAEKDAVMDAWRAAAPARHKRYRDQQQRAAIDARRG